MTVAQSTQRSRSHRNRRTKKLNTLYLEVVMTLEGNSFVSMFALGSLHRTDFHVDAYCGKTRNNEKVKRQLLASSPAAALREVIGGLSIIAATET